ncbi:carboxypeptidase-like regulatory domain-containing protein [Pontibacter silvestris]|uniref:carboxypeptidase-like regulatory domain-containing protein n=1 Tax=Pontibacter silvestris TaxID=2305183 RepID=UPI001E2DD2AC|nr:carboxypeptidase-like regulatory domain-containing protein [Pontibacter silvestris]MCC9137803.1 carboxypeptidase-like regulatory domain-containing protein [Pontibacter silvestris]
MRTIAVAVTIKGTVIDEKTQLVIPYANILVVDQEKHIQADSKGEFAFTVASEKETSRIVVSSLGYVSQEFSVAELLKKSYGSNEMRLPLRPKNVSLNEVEIEAEAEKYKEMIVGYNMHKYSDFHHEFQPLDSLIVKPPGQEIGNKFQSKKYPVYLQDITFSLAGSGNLKVMVAIHIYALKNNLPQKGLLPENVIVQIPPHHTGWITVNLNKYNLSLTDDFAVVVEWLNDANKLSDNSLTTFASKPKGQVTYYRKSDDTPWQVLKSTSIGMYVTLLHKK